LVELDTDMDNPGLITVRKGGRVAFEYSILPMMVKNPVEGLWSWRGQWLLAVNGVLIADSRIVNAEKRVEEIFNWQVLDGKPIYFYVAGGKTKISYDGIDLPMQYDAVIHDQCCEPAAFNPGGGPKKVWFYALKNGLWYYNELGKY
jgi:hypothetical protein